MSSEKWKACLWGDLATLEYGKSLRNYSDGNGNIPVFGTNGPIGFTDKPLCSHPGVIIGRKGAYRGVHYSKKPFFVIDTAFYLSPKAEGLDLKFAYYQLLTQDINGLDSGSAIPSTSREDFYGLDIFLPPLPTQRRIAAILTALDDKIELNQRMNETLEGIAQVVWGEWFGKYANGEEDLPEGWRWGTISDLVVHSKESINPSKLPDQGFKHYSLPAFDNNQVPESSLGQDILSNKYKVWKYSVLVSKLNPRIPRIWAIGDIDEQAAICSTEFQVFLPQEEFYYSFVNLLFQQRTIQEEMQMRASGTSSSHQRVNPKDILEIETVIPPDYEIARFDQTIRSFFEMKFMNSDQSRTLAALRDVLLPRLMRGEISVINQEI